MTTLSKPKPKPMRPDWISKTLAGLLLGLSLAIICSGVLMAILPSMSLAVSGQLAMWLVPLVWLTALSLVYLFSSGLRAWIGLGALNLLALGVWWLLRTGSGT
ncbi:MAG: hypothetical protein I8H77_11030 [Comamonadaceae bacterium]|nr:hypothetical protein [Comamonadaceae bacterium]